MPGAGVIIVREHGRDGFEAASADRIFESTYTAQAGRRGRRGADGEGV